MEIGRGGSLNRPTTIEVNRPYLAQESKKNVANGSANCYKGHSSPEPFGNTCEDLRDFRRAVYGFVCF